LDRAQDMIEYVFQRTSSKLAMAPLLAELYREMKRSSKADDLFNDLLKQAKTQEEKSAVHLAYANFLSAFDESAAIRTYDKAMEEEGESGVQALQAKGDFFAIQARRLADEGKRPESLEKWRESVDLLKKVVAKRPEDRMLQLVLLRRYVEAGMFDQAIEGYQSCIQKDPSDVDAQIGLGLAYLQSDRLDDAEKQFDDVIQSHSDSSDAYMFRAQVHQARANLLKATEDVRKASALSGNLVQVLDLARLYEAMDDVGKAIETYNGVIAENPDFFPAYRNLLDLLIRQKRWGELERSAQAGMTKFPQSPYFPLMMAQAAKNQGQADNELRWLQEALRVVPDDTTVVRQYFQALLNAKDYSRLQQEAQRYINRPPHDIAVAAMLLAAEAKKAPQADKPFQQFLMLLGTAKQPADVFFVGQMMQNAYGPQKLAERASDILGVRPEDWQTYAIIGDAVREAGDFAQAEQNYLKAVQLCKSPAERYQINVRLAQVYERKGDFANVEKTYQEVLKNSPNDILALNNLAYAYVDKLNRPEEALTLIRRAMKLAPGDPNLVDTYAWALAKLGRYQEAVDSFQKVLTKSSASADSLYHMGYCLENTGDLSGAQGFYRRALSSAQSQQNANLVKLLEEAKARIEQKLSKE
jgi:tetratricopeptide (TPR) repeat protein